MTVCEFNLLKVSYKFKRNIYLICIKINIVLKKTFPFLLLLNLYYRKFVYVRANVRAIKSLQHIYQERVCARARGKQIANNKHTPHDTHKNPFNIYLLKRHVASSSRRLDW